MSEYFEQLFFVVLLAIPVACVSWTVSNEEVFRDLREWLDSVSNRSRSLALKKLCYLPTCHYCFSHWVTLLFLVLTGFQFLFDDWRGYILGGFAVVMVANVYLTLYTMLRVYLRYMRARAEEAESRASIVKAEMDRQKSPDSPVCSANSKPGGRNCSGS